MSHPDARPITIFALAQVMIVLLGVMAAGVTSKLLRDATGNEPPPVTLFVLNRGILLCAIPLVWAAVTAHVRGDVARAGAWRTVLLIAGPVIAVGLAIFMLVATLLQLGCVDGTM